MLLLTRKPMQVVKVGPDVTLVVTRVSGGQIRLDIEAPWFAQIERDCLPAQLLPNNPSREEENLPASPLGRSQTDTDEADGEDKEDFLAITWRSNRNRRAN
jgi:sRNA-binding carbon storage regulator CsrA